MIPNPLDPAPVIFADAALARRVESVAARMAIDYVDALARIRPSSGAVALAVAGGIAGFAGVGSPIAQAVGLGMDRPVSAEDLDRLEAFYFDRGSPAQVVTCPLADSSLATLLCARGYRPSEFENILYRGLEPPVAPAGPRAGVDVEATGPEGADVWARVLAEGFAGDPGVPPEIEEVSKVMCAIASARAFLARVDGEPAAAANLILSDGVAFLAGSATLPAWRNRGAHTALLHARLEAAHRLGADLALMGALPGSGSQRNVERLGFRVAYTRVAFLRDPVRKD